MLDSSDRPCPKGDLLLATLRFSADFITFPLDLDGRSCTEHEDHNLLIILRIHHYQGETVDIPYITIPLGIVLNHEYILTICKNENEIISEFTNARVRNLEISKRRRFVLQLFLSTAHQYLNYLRKITKNVYSVEDRLQQSSRNKELLALLKYRKSLTYFTTALKLNELLTERLQRGQILDTDPEDQDLLEDVLT